MAMIREIIFAIDTVRNLEGMRIDMRNNAQGYKDSLIFGKTPAGVLLVIQGDIIQYIKRIKWQEDITADAALRARLKSGIEALGVTSADEIQTDYNELKSAAQNLNKTTESTIEQRADQLLSDLSEHFRVWE